MKIVEFKPGLNSVKILIHAAELETLYNELKDDSTMKPIIKNMLDSGTG